MIAMYKFHAFFDEKEVIRSFEGPGYKNPAGHLFGYQQLPEDHPAHESDIAKVMWEQNVDVSETGRDTYKIGQLPNGKLALVGPREKGYVYIIQD
jgi:hypothetical protein